MWDDILNAEQRAAIESDAPIVIVIAGAGSGKTRMLAAKIADLLAKGNAPEEILAVTFTRKAAAELADRTQGLIAYVCDYASRLPEIRTWHSWAADFLRRHASAIGRTSAFTIYDEADREALVRECARHVGAKNPAKGRLSRLSADAGVALEVSRRLQRADALTFDMIERLTLELLQANDAAKRDAFGRYRYVLVDEYQDTNLAQAAFASTLTGRQLMVVGDPRQAIYQWRGADPSLIQDLQQQGDTHTFYLGRNYRCPPTVVKLANEIAGPDYEPMKAVRAGGPVTPWCGPHVGGMVQDCINDATEAGVPHTSIAVLARSWRELEALSSRLTCDFEIGSPNADPWAQDDWRTIARALRLAHNPADETLALLVAESQRDAAVRYGGSAQRMRNDALRRRMPLVRVLAEYDPAWFKFIREARPEAKLVHLLGILEDLTLTLPDTDFSRWETVADFTRWWESRHLEADAREHEQDHVLLTTIHGAKGLEWDAVIVADPRESTYGTENPEDRRLLYVAVTRARERLYLCARPDMAPGPWGCGAVLYPAPTPLLPEWAT